MAYQVLARKWRPQRFDDVIGQHGVTQTLRNAIGAKRIAQSFVFSGPRGVGKTTTARILARALNCEQGPTAEPCGTCDACVEIAQGRDIDVLEIDAATNTQVDKVREIIVAGLGIAPVRNRYKIFIIDEVHRLSAQAFDALLKSIEEPPPHVVFMMATTEIGKVPATIQSRSQVFELKSIGLKPIADQLRRIADAEGIAIDDQAIMLIARAGDGSMRDAQSAFDQVIAFAGSSITAEDVTTVLGLVRRDLLLDIAAAVADENAGAVFELAGRAVESGYDLRLVLRELSRVTRDLLVLAVDPSRASDPEIAAESERDALVALAGRFSREDLMRAFDVLTKAEYDLRGSTQPRYHLEMALLRWIHLRKLTPIEDVIQSLSGGGSTAPTRAVGRPAPAQAPPRSIPAPVRPAPPPRASAAAPSPPAPIARADKPRPAAAPPAADRAAADRTAASPAELKAAFLGEIRKAKKFFHGTVVAQAQRIDVETDRIVFVFGPQHRALRQQFDQSRSWLETLASDLSGRRIAVVAETNGAAAPAAPGNAAAPEDARRAALKEQALADSGVQAMLDVFAAEITDVEER
ncbi:MAG TPA: DNA polymerase III subunit gamma/tau [Vicinamibacterales bacterium]|nr:DNA polymerase III subunit gamma/tau [Vicinamibacterales bacterium]